MSSSSQHWSADQIIPGHGDTQSSGLQVTFFKKHLEDNFYSFISVTVKVQVRMWGEVCGRR